MNNDTPQRVPTEINLHQKSRILAVTFSDGQKFEFPCEYLRVFSRAADVRALQQPVTGKEDVNISKIEPVGHYALRLHFDDGHDTGAYSWNTLYELGLKQEKNWQEYLRRLEAIGYRRTKAGRDARGKRRVKVLYFAFLVRALRKETEEVQLPESVNDVNDLLGWLARRGSEWERFLSHPEQVRVTVNKQFAERFTRLEGGDEVGIVPAMPEPLDV